jgi:glycosyltransferase involved in cell wall biosynthesis
MQAKVERWICTYADIAIWFTDQALASAIRRNPALGDRGKMVIPGVDKSNINLEPYAPGEKFVIGHFGSLSPRRNLVIIIHALEILILKRPEAEDLIELHVYGGPLDPVSEATLNASTARKMIQYFGRIEMDPKSGKTGRDIILQKMRSADLLLLLHGAEPICSEYIPSKLYEYLWTQRPVISTVSNNSQMAGILRVFQHDCVEIENDAKSERQTSEYISAIIDRLFQSWGANGLPDNCNTSPYTTLAAVREILQLTSQNHDLI